jgi:hypothetical protein
MKVFHVTLHCIFVQGGGKVVAIDLTSENKASQQKNEETLLPLLPRRPNSKPCEFFMKTGTCAYGSKCIWDHPKADDAGALQGKIQKAPAALVAHSKDETNKMLSTRQSRNSAPSCPQVATGLDTTANPYGILTKVDEEEGQEREQNETRQSGGSETKSGDEKQQQQQQKQQQQQHQRAMHGAETEQKEEEKNLTLGDLVQIHSLLSSPEHNSIHGIIVEPCNEKTGRWGVQIQPKRVLALRGANIKPARPSLRETQLHGIHATIGLWGPDISQAFSHLLEVCNCSLSIYICKCLIIVVCLPFVHASTDLSELPCVQCSFPLSLQKSNH